MWYKFLQSEKNKTKQNKPKKTKKQKKTKKTNKPKQNKTKQPPKINNNNKTNQNKTKQKIQDYSLKYIRPPALEVHGGTLREACPTSPRHDTDDNNDD